MKKSILFMGAFLLVAQLCYAQVYTKTWKGGGQFNFFADPNNWDPVGVPNSGDVVKIPSGTPVCVIPSSGDFHAIVGELHNYGEVSMVGAAVFADKFNNYNKINVSSDTEIEGNDDGAVFNNSGIIGETGLYGGILHISKFNEIYNSGELNSRQYNISGTNIVNSGNINSSDAASGGNSTIIADNLTNNGAICTDEEVGAFDKTSGLIIQANTVTNNNLIKTGDSDSDKAGNIQITAKHLNNNKWIFSGNGESPEKNGKIKLKCDKIDNKGTIKAGHSVGSGMNPNFDLYFNEVALYADTVLISGDSVKMEADTLRFVFSYMKLSDIADYGQLYADVRIEFFSTQDGVLDLSEGLDQYIISCANYEGIHFYCNNIVPPSQGMDYICDVPANIHPADTTIVQAALYSKQIYDDPGNSGSFYIHLQNNGTGSMAFDYNISSTQNWINESSGTIQLLAPFQTDSILVDYSIPAGEFNQADTIDVTLSTDGYSLTGQSYLYSNPDETSGIGNHENELIKSITVSPNPFSTSTTISYTLMSKSNTLLNVYNANGLLVYNKDFGSVPQGEVRLNWNGTGNTGEKLKPGIYCYQLLSGNKIARTGKIVIN